jgi:AcrR family transcriptional regulator
MAAVVASIAEVGYRKTTAAEIARRAGVTWGAVQHHFGDKNGILAAVLSDTFGRFAERLGRPPAGANLAARVGGFVDRAWEHFAIPHYRASRGPGGRLGQRRTSGVTTTVPGLSFLRSSARATTTSAPRAAGVAPR